MSHRPLERQIALVTGGNAGIGRACALALSRAGAAVAVNHRPNDTSAEAAEAVVKTIEDAGGQALAVPADVSDEGQVATMFKRVLGHFGKLDTLVSNAGIEQPATFTDMSLKDWRAVMDVNLTGQFLCAREAVRHFQDRAPGRYGNPTDSAAGQRRHSALGRIVMMSSVHEVIPWAFQVNYAAAKGGVAMLMRSLAQEVACDRIRVNAVAPGAIRTKINREAWETEEKLEALLRLIPYGRIGEPDDVARAVVWLASDESDYVTGTTLFVDGGMTLYPEFRGNG